MARDDLTGRVVSVRRGQVLRVLKGSCDLLLLLRLRFSQLLVVRAPNHGVSVNIIRLTLLRRVLLILVLLRMVLLGLMRGTDQELVLLACVRLKGLDLHPELVVPLLQDAVCFLERAVLDFDLLEHVPRVVILT